MENTEKLLELESEKASLFQQINEINNQIENYKKSKRKLPFKDCVILVYNVYVGNMDEIDIPSYMEEIKNTFVEDDETVIQYFIPTHDKNKGGIYCLHSPNN